VAKIRVLIVDDSSVVRTFLQTVLKTDPDIDVVGWAPDPFIAREKLIELSPDVMVLDVEMPKMDGITFLGKVMAHKPTRTLIFSSLTVANSPLVLQAFDAGAIDVLAKPEINVATGLSAIAKELISKIKEVAAANLSVTIERLNQNKITPTAPKTPLKSLSKTTHQIIAIAASTGGTEALKDCLSKFPADTPGIVIVQHMPPVFTKAFAQSLQKLCTFEIREAEDGDKIIPGRALLAPGNFHMEVVRHGGYYHVKLHQEPQLHGVRPAADFLFKSLAEYAGSNVTGVILTGMGRDGADGLVAMKAAGAYTIAQDEETCVVYGMPKAAMEAGAIKHVLPLSKIPDAIFRHLSTVS
jgi:two-component system, chemotaxis family, protein-glutamate methylesterase/glutaminase